MCADVRSRERRIRIADGNRIVEKEDGGKKLAEFF